MVAFWRAAEVWRRNAKPSFECVGVPGIIDGIIASAPLFSRVVVVGVPAGLDHPSAMASTRSTCGLRPRLIIVRSSATRHMLADGKVNAAPLITGTVGLPGVAAAFDALGDPEAHAKIMIDPRATPRVPTIPRGVNDADSHGVRSTRDDMLN